MGRRVDAWSHHPSRATRRRMRARHSRGVAIVEAAFITPVFLFLILGVVELSLVLNDHLAVANAVRAGSRTASASGDNPYADYGTVRRTLSEASAVPEAQIDRIVVYKSSGFGEAPTEQCRAGVSTPGVCNVYTAADWSRPREDWACALTTSPDRHWCPTDRKVTLEDGGSDFVGVWMTVRHPWITGLFGSEVTLTDSSVIRLEPRRVS